MSKETYVHVKRDLYTLKKSQVNEPLPSAEAPARIFFFYVYRSLLKCI